MAEGAGKEYSLSKKLPTIKQMRTKIDTSGQRGGLGLVVSNQAILL